MGFYVSNNEYTDADMVSDRIAAKEKGNVIINIYNGTDEETLPVADCLELGDIKITAMIMLISWKFWKILMYVVKLHR